MTLTLGSGPFAPHPAGQWNFRREGPRHAIYWEDYLPRVRGLLAGETVVDTRRAKLLHETGLLPVVYVPRDDVRFDLLEPTEHTTHCPFKGDAGYWTLRVGDRVAENKVWGYPEPLESAPPLAGYVAFYHDALDAWLAEDEPVVGHFRDPYHRVDVYPAARHVVVRVDGEVVAESDRPQLLFETGLPVRYYLPLDDVRADLLTRSDTVSQCPYKGAGQHWTLGEITDVAWTLPDPLPIAAAARDHVAFYPDKVELEVDGERVTR